MANDLRQLVGRARGPSAAHCTRCGCWATLWRFARLFTSRLRDVYG